MISCPPALITKSGHQFAWLLVPFEWLVPKSRGQLQPLRPSRIVAAWLNLFSLILGYLQLVTVGAGLVALFVGASNLRDLVWPKRSISLSIPERSKPGLYRKPRDLVNAAKLPAMLAGTTS